MGKMSSLLTLSPLYSTDSSVSRETPSAPRLSPGNPEISTWIQVTGPDVDVEDRSGGVTPTDLRNDRDQVSSRHWKRPVNGGVRTQEQTFVPVAGVEYPTALIRCLDFPDRALVVNNRSTKNDTIKRSAFHDSEVPQLWVASVPGVRHSPVDGESSAVSITLGPGMTHGQDGSRTTHRVSVSQCETLPSGGMDEHPNPVYSRCPGKASRES